MFELDSFDMKAMFEGLFEPGGMQGFNLVKVGICNEL